MSLDNASVLSTASNMPTLYVDHPNLNAASCANSSPKPSISPLTNGNTKFIAAPRSRLQNVGGWYMIIGRLEEDGGDGEISLFESS